MSQFCLEPRTACPKQCGLLASLNQVARRFHKVLSHCPPPQLFFSGLNHENLSPLLSRFLEGRFKTHQDKKMGQSRWKAIIALVLVAAASSVQSVPLGLQTDTGAQGTPCAVKIDSPIASSLSSRLASLSSS